MHLSCSGHAKLRVDTGRAQYASAYCRFTDSGVLRAHPELAVLFIPVVGFVKYEHATDMKINTADFVPSFVIGDYGWSAFHPSFVNTMGCLKGYTQGIHS